MLNGESADVPEDIVVDWALGYPRSATATSRRPFSAWTILLCIAVGVCVPEGTCYIGRNSQIPRGRQFPLIRPHQCDPEGGRIRGVLLYLKGELKGCDTMILRIN